MSRLVTDHLPLLAGAPNGVKLLRELIFQTLASGPFPSVRISDVVSFSNGYAFKSEWFSQTGIPLVRNTNIGHGNINWNDAARIPKERLNEFSSFALQAGDLLLSLDRPIISTGLKMAIVREVDLPCLLLQRVAKLDPNPSLLYKPYLIHWLKSESFTAAIDPGRSNGIPHISTRQVGNLSIKLPPLAEQHRIVAKVDELMALCDRLETRQSDAQAAHARLVDELLGSLLQARDAEDFAASWGRLTREFEQTLTTESALDMFRATVLELAYSGRLTSVGKDAPWKTVKLGAVAKLINGDRGSNYPNRSEYVDEGVPFINTGHINPDGSLDLASMHYLTREKFDSLRSGKIEPNDLVYCLRGATLGKTAFVRPFQEGAIASSLVIIRFAPEVLPEFAYYYLISPQGRQWIYKFDNGSAQPNLAASSVKEYEIPLPSISDQHRIVAKLDELLALCDHLKVRMRQAQQMQERLAGILVERAVL